MNNTQIIKKSTKHNKKQLENEIILKNNKPNYI